jgi:uncharacterized membrane protein YtjA (UPF0391 family)
MTLSRWVVILLILALIAALLGFGAIVSAAAGIAKLAFYVILALVAIVVIAGLSRRG